MSLTAISSPIGEMKIFMNSSYIIENRNQTFLGLGGQDESNSQ